MATCQVLIKRALRMLGELNAGREPPAGEAADALQALQGLYMHLLASGTFGRLSDTYVTTSPYTAHENERIINGTGGALVITLPVTVQDSDTYGDTASDIGSDYGFAIASTNTRPPRDRSAVMEAGASPRLYLYDADLAAWVLVNALALTDPAPFTQKLETGMAALLATHIAAEYRDAPPSATVQVGAAQCMAALTQRADSRDTVTAAEFF